MPQGPQWAKRSTTHYWLGKWQQDLTLSKVVSLLREKAEAFKMIDLERLAVDGFFSGGKGGGEEESYGYKGKGMTNHLLVDNLGNPLHITTTGADKDEKEQVNELLIEIEKPLRQYRLTGKVTILEADKGYDRRLCRFNVLLKQIFPWIPYRNMGKVYADKVGICYLERKRWQCERAIAWLQRKYRRIVCRWERRIKFWKGFLNFALIAYWLFKISNFID